MNQKFTVVLMHRVKGPLTFCVQAQSPKEAAKQAIDKVTVKNKDLIDTVAGVFIGWHINKFFGEV